jgi:DNA invertase Pin-like site-specific DNA recombinase
MKAIGYVRVSTDEQAREGISLDNQKVKIAAYCQLNDLDLVEIIEDAGKSGKDLNRPGIQAVIEKVKHKDIDALVCYKMDRLSRRVVDTLSLMQLIEKNHVAFHSITEKVDTHSALGKFFLNIMASLNQMERDLISERTKDALSMKIARRERVGSVRYGYTLAEDGKTLLENPTEQAAIQLIKDLAGKGYSYRAICRELDHKGYEPVGKQWHHKTISNILQRAA